MTNDPISAINTEGLSAPIAEAVNVLKAALAAHRNDGRAFAAAQALAEVTEKLRALGA